MHREMDGDAAVLAALIARTSGRVLLIQQLMTDLPVWKFPGGKHERGEKIIDTLTREMQEETGVDLYALDNLRKRIVYSGGRILPSGKGRGTHKQFFIAVVVDDDMLPLDGSIRRADETFIRIGLFSPLKLHALPNFHAPQLPLRQKLLELPNARMMEIAT